MSIKGENGVSDNALGYANGQLIPTCVAVQLAPNAAYSIGGQRFFGVPSGKVVIVVPQSEARNVPGTIITSPDVDLDFFAHPGVGA